MWEKVTLHLNYLIDLLDKVGKDVTKLPQLYGDWCPPPKNPGGAHKELPSRGFTSAFSIIRTIQQAADLARAIGNQSQSNCYTLLVEELKGKFHKGYYSPETKTYDNGAMVTFVLPLALGVVPTSDKTAFVDGLVKHIILNRFTWTGGIMNNRYLFDVLSENGHKNLTLRMLAKRDYPSYGYMYFNKFEPAVECMWEIPDAPFQGIGTAHKIISPEKCYQNSQIVKLSKILCLTLNIEISSSIKYSLKYIEECNTM